jgi:hypothetical protein
MIGLGYSLWLTTRTENATLTTGADRPLTAASSQ